MKKIIYVAAAMAMFAGCAKNEIIAPVAEETYDLSMSLMVDNAIETKSYYNGNGFIDFESGDCIYVAIAKESAPTTAIKVGTGSSSSATVYASKFTIADATSETPEFSGSIYSVSSSDLENEYILYGFFPGTTSLYNNIKSTSDLTNWVMAVPASQTSTQTSWSEDADVMLMKQTTVSFAEASSNYRGYYTSASEQVKFAHLFGFGKFTFASAPEEYANEVVKSVTIEATGDNQNLSGTYYLDITKDIREIELTAKAATSTITLTGDGETTVSDYVAWFVANPGTFDVKVTVATGMADLIFEREGLVINRSEIASATINYKASESDTYVSHDVELVDGEAWSQSFTSTTTLLSSSTRTRSWGPTGKEMSFTVSYPNTTTSGNSPGYLMVTNSGGKYVQTLSSKQITGEGAGAKLYSEAKFKGIKRVQLSLGNGVNNITNDFTVKLVNGTEETVLGKITTPTGSSTATLDNVYLFNTTDVEDGQLVIWADNFSDATYVARPYVGFININPAPEITLSETSLSISKDAYSGSVTCTVDLADGDPTVATDADWITASYYEGNISISCTENTGSRREGTITVTASAAGLPDTVETITVTQEGVNQTEYVLTFNAADIWTEVEANKPEDASDDTPVLNDYTKTYTVSPTDETITDKDLEVTLSIKNVNATTSTETYVSPRAGSDYVIQFTCTSELGFIKEVAVVTEEQRTNSYTGMALKLSADGESWTSISEFTTTGDAAPYTTTFTNESDSYTWFNLQSQYYTVKVYSFTVKFVKYDAE